MHPQLQYTTYSLNNEFWFLLLVLILLSSIVIADPELGLPDEFNELNVDTIFSNGSKFRKPEKEEEIEWRAKDSKPQELNTNIRWGATSIYENSDDPDPFGSNSDQSNKVLRSPEASPQLEIRF